MIPSIHTRFAEMFYKEIFLRVGARKNCVVRNTLIRVIDWVCEPLRSDPKNVCTKMGAVLHMAQNVRSESGVSVSSE